MAEAKHSKKRPPEAGPKEAASRIDRFLRDAPALFEHAGVQPWPTYSLPAGLSRLDLIAASIELDARRPEIERQRQEFYMREHFRHYQIRTNPNYPLELAADGRRLAGEARAVAVLLADAGQAFIDLQAMARKMEATPVDWRGAREAFEAARPPLEAGMLHYEAKARALPPPGGVKAGDVVTPADRPQLDDEARLRVRVGGTWHDISDEAMRMMSILFKAEGAWVQGSTISRENRPDKTRKRMPAAVSAIIESHKRHGYRIPSLLPQ